MKSAQEGEKRSPGRRSARESLLTQERVLAEAERHFARHGYAGTSVRELGMALGIAGSSVLHHVGSKRKLYAEVLRRIAVSIAPVLGHIDRGVPAEAMRQLAERLLIWSELNPHYVQILLREMMENPARIDEVHRWQLADFLQQALRFSKAVVGARGRKKGGIDPDMLLLVLLGSVSYFHVALTTFNAIRGGEARELRRRFLGTIEAMLQASLPVSDPGG
ncbi:MAG: TetR/AcrR family transcriptional regulator [Burkholderiales bacterium]|nr:TetR/AcrR family transcriptional regulator [Burkholderiales bacterium]